MRYSKPEPSIAHSLTSSHAFFKGCAIFVPKKGGRIMKIEKLKSGSYRIRKMYRGVTYTVVTDYKPTQKEAIQLLAAEMDKAMVKKERMTFETAAREYMAVKENVISPSTIRGYSSILRNLPRSFTEKIISDITSIDVQKEINLYSKNHTAKTVKNVNGFISAVLGMFCPNTILNTTLPQKIKSDPYIPSDEDVKKVVEASKGTVYEIPILLAAYGLRRSEICALTMDDVGSDTITISKAKVMGKDSKWVIKSTKTTESSRTIYVPEELTNKIRQAGKIYCGSPGSISRYLAETQDRLGIPRFSLHKLRHYYASMSHSLGIPDQYIMQSGGWKTDNVLKNVYQHAMDDKKIEMQKFASDYIKAVIS